MNRYLALISLLLFSLSITATSAKPEILYSAIYPHKTCIMQGNCVILHPATLNGRYSVLITFRDAGLTGVCIVKPTDEGLVGTIVNEFGIKAFDFTYDSRKQKVKLHNVIKMMNRWYIKKVVKADLKVLLTTEESGTYGRRTLDRKPDGSVKLTNEKYNISYSFTPLHE